MRISRFTAIAFLSLGCPMLLWASTLSSSASCNIRDGQLILTRNRTELAPLLLLMGIGQGVVAASLLRKKPKVAAVETVRAIASIPDQSLPSSGALMPLSLPSSHTEDMPQKNVEFAWVNEFDGYPSALIFGPQGSGKTSIASFFMHRRQALGHRLEVLDPHREFGQWEGLKCYGDGMNYAEIDKRLEAFCNLIKTRYEQRANQPNCTFELITVLCDEFTSWAAKCEHSAEFFTACLSDIRKIGLHVIFVSHARTMPALGGSKGLAATRDAALLELELLAKVDPETKKAVPKLEGFLKLPGGEKQTVKIAPWMKGDMNFQGSHPEQVRTSEPVDVQPLNPRQAEDLTPLDDKQGSGSEPSVPAHLEASFSAEPDSELSERIKEMKALGMTKEQIILAIWGARKGGSEKYKKASADYDRLTHE